MLSKLYKWFLAGIVLGGSSVYADVNNELLNRSAHAQTKMDQRDQNFKQLMLDKEGWIEGGVELLVMTSTIRSFYGSGGVITQGSPPPNSVAVSKGGINSLNPGYDIGFAADLRYRSPSDNHIGGYYRYINNSGQDSAVTLGSGSSTTIANATATFDTNDNASFNLHSHIVDLLYGRALPLAPGFFLKLEAGVAYNDFHFGFHIDDMQTVTNVDNATGNVVTRQLNIVKGNQKERFWGVGPKLKIGFEWFFLPLSWKHDLNVSLDTEFAFFYSKEWSKGKLFSVSEDLNTRNEVLVNWEAKPKYETIPNINLDLGLEYRYHLANGVSLGFAVGYQVLAYWQLDELNRHPFFAGQDDLAFFLVANALDDHFMYSGGYFRFSVAY